MTAREERQELIALCDEAVMAGARWVKIAEVTKVHPRTIGRWRVCAQDRRPSATRPQPANALSVAEQDAIIEVCNKKEYSSSPPAQIVADLADQGRYIGSVSSYYRTLHARKQLAHRGRTNPPLKKAKPTSYKAEKPNQVWSWDITWMPSQVRGIYFYLYLVLDIFSRKIVGWEVYEHECGELAANLMERASLQERCPRTPLVLHSDNGSPMKSQTLQVKLIDLGIEKSYSRPRVSNDNPYSEAIFRTCKYNRDYPFKKGFKSLEEARTWVLGFVRWYNDVHRHSGINYVTPNQKHRGEDREILLKRAQVYEQAKQKNPNRWTGNIRDWSPVTQVWLNPDKDQTDNGIILKAAS